MNISNIAIKRPVLTFVAMILIIILGIVSLWKIPLKLMPDINPPIGAVVASYPGASPNEVLEKVTKPLENQLSTLPGLKSISSTTEQGSSLTILEFNWDVPLDEVESDILSRIQQAELPDDVSDPKLLKFDPSQLPIIQIALTSAEQEADFYRSVRSLEQKLMQVEGIASIQISGIAEEEINVELNQEKLEQYQLTINDIVEIIRANNISLPGVPITTLKDQLSSRIISSLTSVADIENIIVTVDPVTQTKVRLADIANVAIVAKEELTYTRVNQEPAVMMSVMQQSDANTATVSADFRDRLEQELQHQEYENLKFIVLNDQGEYVNLAIRSIRDALLLGGAFAMIVLFFFLRNIASPLIVGISIPFSVIFTFVLLYFADFSLNIMTLGGLALGIGMLVDNSIVVIENINSHLAAGKGRKIAAFEGTKEVAGAIAASTFTTIAVFIPILFTSGIVGNIFKQFSLTISFSLLASLLVALTVVPMFASKFLKQTTKEVNVSGKSYRYIESGVRWALQHRLLVLIITVALLAAGILGLATVGAEFLPITDEGYFSIDIVLQEGTTLEETSDIVEQAESLLDEKQIVKNYLTLVGATQSSLYSGASMANTAQIIVNLADKQDRSLSTSQFIDEIERDIRQLLPEAQQIVFNQQTTVGFEANTLTFTVRNDNRERLYEEVNNIHKAIRDIDGVVDVQSTLANTTEEAQIIVDRDKAFAHGFAPAEVATLVNQALRGMQATLITTAEDDVYNVQVTYDEKFIENTDRLRQLLLRKKDGSFVRLDQVAAFERGESQSTINRIAMEDAVEMTVKFSSDYQLGDITKSVQEQIDKLHLANETTVSFTGDTELMVAAFQDLSLAISLAIIFVYLIMAGQFESFRYPFVIMVSIPLIVIGVALALFLTATPIGITAVIGILVLTGIVVNNAIVLVDFILQKKKQGVASFEAICLSVKNRSRPIFMTALTTILGLVPISLGIGEGTEIQQPMGIAVIGGLVSSTLLTLFVIPVIYSLFDKETRTLTKKVKKPIGAGVGAIDEQLKELSKEELLQLIEEIRRKK